MSSEEELKKEIRELRSNLQRLSKNPSRTDEYAPELSQTDQFAIAGEKTNYLGDNASLKLENAQIRDVNDGLIKVYPKTEKTMKEEMREVVNSQGSIERAYRALLGNSDFWKQIVPLAIIIVAGAFGFYLLKVLQNPQVSSQLFTQQNESDIMLFGIIAVAIVAYIYFNRRRKK